MSVYRRRGLFIVTALVWGGAATCYVSGIDSETHAQLLIRSATTVIGLALFVASVMAWLLHPILTNARVWLAIGTHQGCDCMHGHQRPPLRSVAIPMKRSR